jgi:predicted RNA-binding Zn-ribbon protein involved in translation (DUF1610 family)
MDELDRLFHRLVQNIRSKSPSQLTVPFTVAELYEQLVPYRHNRRELGIETNQDYETTINRLLSGERGYLVGDAAMQESLRKEMSGAKPDTGAFREYASAEVSISPDALRSLGAAATSAAAQTATTGATARAAPAAEPGGSPVAAASRGAASAATGTARARDGAQSARTMPSPAVAIPFDGFAVAEGCKFCGAALPEGRDVKYCPNCGQNLSITRCPACGSELQADWKYCIACGRPAGL